MKPFTVSQMEQMIEQGCMIPGCDHKDHNEIWVHQRCHPRAGLEARYEKGSAVVNLVCHECKKPVLDVSVALI